MVLDAEDQQKKDALVPQHWSAPVHVARFSKAHRQWCKENNLEKGKDYQIWNTYLVKAGMLSDRVFFKDSYWATAFALKWS
jgi:hypothetical protein